MRINFLGLQAFLSIAERGSFRRAASHLNLSQTAISHRMKKLEEELGLKLFARTTREVSLTQAGLNLMSTAKVAVAQLESSLDEIRRQGTSRKGRLSIACLNAFAIYRLPSVLMQFKKSYPNIEVRIHEVASFEVADLLLRDEAEFGLSVVSTNRWNLDVEPLIKADPLVLACNSRHDLARRPFVRWTDLRKLPLIRVGTNTSIRSTIDDALGSMQDELDWQYEVQAIETALSLAESGCGVAVLPRSNVVLHGSKGLVGRPIGNPSMSVSFGLVTKRGVPLSPIAEDFCDLLRVQTMRETQKMKGIH